MSLWASRLGRAGYLTMLARQASSFSLIEWRGVDAFQHILPSHVRMTLPTWLDVASIKKSPSCMLKRPNLLWLTHANGNPQRASEAAN